MGSPKKALNRPKKRTLVRWDENLNELLLLTVQSVCNQQGVKIPWAVVAETMGNNVTEGAIVQHLAKLRTRRIAANKEVPPPLRRGGSNSLAIVKAKAEPKAIAGSSSVKDSRKNKGKKPASLSDEDEVLDLPETWEESSDEEYGKRRRCKTSKNSQRKKAKANSGEVVIKVEDTDADTDMDNNSDELVGVGAQFLNFSNYRELSESPVADSQDTEPNESKMVILTFNERRTRFARLVKLLEGEDDSAVQQSQALVVSDPYGQDHYQVSQVSETNVDREQNDGVIGFPTFSNQLHNGLPNESMYGRLFNENNYQPLHHAAGFSPNHNDYQDHHDIGSFAHSQQEQGTFLPYPNALINQYADLQDSTGYSEPLQSAPIDPNPWVDAGMTLNDNNRQNDQSYALVPHKSSPSDSGDTSNPALSGVPDSVPKEGESFEDEGYADIQAMHANVLNQFLGYPWIGSPDTNH